LFDGKNDFFKNEQFMKGLSKVGNKFTYRSIFYVDYDPMLVSLNRGRSTITKYVDFEHVKIKEDLSQQKKIRLYSPGSCEAYEFPLVWKCTVDAETKRSTTEVDLLSYGVWSGRYPIETAISIVREEKDDRRALNRSMILAYEWKLRVLKQDVKLMYLHSSPGIIVAEMSVDNGTKAYDERLFNMIFFENLLEFLYGWYEYEMTARSRILLGIETFFQEPAETTIEEYAPQLPVLQDMMLRDILKTEGVISCPSSSSYPISILGERIIKMIT
jgi:hypothetical protein